MDENLALKTRKRMNRCALTSGAMFNLYILCIMLDHLYLLLCCRELASVFVFVTVVNAPLEYAEPRVLSS
jgi:hypothetical protein